MDKLLFITDLDGTFLQSDHDFSKFNHDVAQKAIDAGHHFCIATGRSWTESKNVYEKLNLKAPIVNTNGSHIHFPGDDSFEEYLNLMKNDVIEKIINSPETQGAFKGFYVEGMDHNYICNIPREFLHDASWKVPYKELKLGEKIKVEGKMLSIILVIDTKDDEKRIAKFLADLNEGLNFWAWSIPVAGQTNAMEINTSSTKADGLRILRDHYGIKPENVISFGDQRNDLEMITESGFGVAMANGQEVLKEAADYVSEWTNNEDAVGKEIMKILENGIPKK